MAIAVRNGAIGYIMLEGQDLSAWGISFKIPKTKTAVQEQVQKWIECGQPDVVVTENLQRRCRKRGKTRDMAEFVAATAENKANLHVTVVRQQRYRNRYKEADELVRRFPQLRSHSMSKPRLWEAEPRRLIIFEALSMALQVRQENHQG